jgi:hypothetical protein
MKKERLLLFFAILFCSFVNAQDSVSLKSRKHATEEYIIKKDSSKLYGNVKQRQGKVFLDDEEYDLNLLLGYKEGNHYHAVFGNSIYWVYALGKIQAYMQWQFDGSGKTGQPQVLDTCVRKMGFVTGLTKRNPYCNSCK